MPTIYYILPIMSDENNNYEEYIVIRAYHELHICITYSDRRYRMRENMRTQGFEIAKEQYAACGVDVEAAILRADAIPVSMHCWQGDDVIGFDG